MLLFDSSCWSAGRATCLCSEAGWGAGKLESRSKEASETLARRLGAAGAHRKRVGECHFGLGGVGTVWSTATGISGAVGLSETVIWGWWWETLWGWLDAFIWRESAFWELLFRASPAAILGWMAGALISRGRGKTPCTVGCLSLWGLMSTLRRKWKRERWNARGDGGEWGSVTARKLLLDPKGACVRVLVREKSGGGSAPNAGVSPQRSSLCPGPKNCSCFPLGD